MASVRPAAPADAQVLVAMGRAMHAESPRYRERRWDEDKVRQAIGLFTTPPAEVGVVLLVAEEAGKVVGMAAMFVAQDWFGPDRTVTDRVVYVSPEHRGGTAFARLVRAAEAWAAAQGVTEVDIGVSTGVHVEQTVCAYERMGYTLLPTRVVSKKLNHVHRT